jgi:hypothetical protein
MPWIRIYLDRLGLTTVTPAAAAIAAAAITGHDEWFRDAGRVLGYHATGIIPVPGEQLRTGPGRPPDSVPLLARPPVPGGPAGPAPRL